MARHLRFEPQVSMDELGGRYQPVKDSHERRWWQILWLLARGHTTKERAERHVFVDTEGLIQAVNVPKLQGPPLGAVG